MWYHYINPFKKGPKEKSKPEEIYGYDFDGVVSIGVNPRSNRDVIITGRCIDEADYVLEILKERGIKNTVYFNPMTLEERGNHTLKARRFSGNHKSKTINKLRFEGKVKVTRFFEDDPVQLKIIKERCHDVEMVQVLSQLVKK